MTRMEKTDKPREKEKDPSLNQMDTTLEDTFPASDPPSWSQPKDHKRPEKELKTQNDERKGRPEEQTQSFSKDEFMSGAPKSDTKH